MSTSPEPVGKWPFPGVLSPPLLPSLAHLPFLLPTLTTRHSRKWPPGPHNRYQGVVSCSVPWEAEPCRLHPGALAALCLADGGRGATAEEKAAGESLGYFFPAPSLLRCPVSGGPGPVILQDCRSCRVEPAPGLQPLVGSSHSIHPLPLRAWEAGKGGEWPPLWLVPGCLHISVSLAGFLNPLQSVPPSTPPEPSEWNVYAAGTSMASQHPSSTAH